LRLTSNSFKIAPAKAVRTSSLKTEYRAAKSFPHTILAHRSGLFSVSTEIAALILQDLRETDAANSFVRNILRASRLESIFYPDQPRIGSP
jgi:hypothetical protein